MRIEGFSLVQHVYLIRDRKALNSPAVSAWWKFVESKVGAIRELPAHRPAEALAGSQEGGSVRTEIERPQEAHEVQPSGQEPGPGHLLGQMPREGTAEVPATIGG